MDNMQTVNIERRPRKDWKRAALTYRGWTVVWVMIAFFLLAAFLYALRGNHALQQRLNDADPATTILPVEYSTPVRSGEGISCHDADKRIYGGI